MKPTRVHYFYAQNWPARIWIVIIPSLCVVLMARALGTPPKIGGFQADARSYLILLAIAWLLGLCVAALLGTFILAPLYRYRAQLNGYPFQPGDRVEILVGASRGRVVHVVEVCDWRGSLRLDLGELASPRARTSFHFAQVIKATDAEPPDPAQALPVERRWTEDGPTK